MKFHKQANRHDPDNGVFGDCYRTVLACLLDLERDEVPHWVTTMSSDEWVSEVQPKYNRWLRERGLQELAIPLEPVSLTEALKWQKTRTPYDSACMMTGTSGNDCNHVVIVAGGKIIHDPVEDGVGLIGPAEDGFYWLTWLIPTSSGGHQ